MARLGEGDERWIVKEREDGKNVGNWHWSETNCLKFTEEGLREKLFGLPLTEGSELGLFQVSELTKCEGDCYTYNRKGKMYLFYDINANLKWTGPNETEGTVELPNLSDDIEKEDMEIRVTCSSSPPNVDKIKQEIRKLGRPVLQAAILTFLEDLRGRVQSKVNSSTAPSSTNSEPSSTQTQSTKPKDAPKSTTETIDLHLNFGCEPGQLYDALTNAQRVMGYTSAPASIDLRVGGRFEFFAGSISGEFKELVPNQKIVQSWRMKSWPENVWSTVTLTMTGEHQTKLHLKHEDIPSRDATGSEVLKQVEQGWQHNFFNRLRSAFGWREEDM
jgi:activator of HSP90 ATPase